MHPNVEKLWSDYLTAERDRVRGQFMLALDQFITTLLIHDETVWHEWALDLARDISDHHRDIPVRLPLFREVLLPATSTPATCNVIRRKSADSRL